MSKIFEETYLIENFLATADECQEEIQANGAAPIGEYLGRIGVTQIHDFANGLLWADFRNWMQTGQSKVHGLYEKYVAKKMADRLFESDPYEKEIERFLAARNGGQNK